MTGWMAWKASLEEVSKGATTLLLFLEENTYTHTMRRYRGNFVEGKEYRIVNI